MKDTSSSIYFTTNKSLTKFKGWLSVFLVCILLFACITYAVVTGKIQKIDLLVSGYVSAKLVNPSLTAFLEKFTDLGSAFLLRIVYALMVLYCFGIKKYREAIAILITGGLSFLLSDLLKIIFHRERPIGSLIGPVQQFSYPSGHAMASIVFYGLLTYLVSRSNMTKANKIGFSIFILSIALIIAFSRIYLQAHYASDVVAGLLIGTAWLMLMILLFEKFGGNAAKNSSLL